jgi:hypothetical protein
MVLQFRSSSREEEEKEEKKQKKKERKKQTNKQTKKKEWMYVSSCGVERKLTTWLLPKPSRGCSMELADEPFQSEIQILFRNRS